MDTFKRIESLIGKNALEKLKRSSVAVFGVGGVGGYAVEALVRSGVGNISVFDDDVVKESNLNRQIIATTETLGEYKTYLIKNRAKSINPDIRITENRIFYLPENSDSVDLSEFDYVIDAIDTVTAKIELIVRAKSQGVPIISGMGTGGKLDPDRLEVSDISKTSVCPLARVMRRELKRRGITHLDVVYSTEPSKAAQPDDAEKKASGRTAPPSMIFVPASAGLLLASFVVKALIKD